MPIPLTCSISLIDLSFSLSLFLSLFNYNRFYSTHFYYYTILGSVLNMKVCNVSNVCMYCAINIYVLNYIT